MGWFAPVLMAVWSICCFVLAALVSDYIAKRTSTGWGLLAAVTLIPLSVGFAAVPWLLAAQVLAQVAGVRP